MAAGNQSMVIGAQEDSMVRANFADYDTEDIRRKDRDHFIHPFTNFATFEKEGSDVMAESEGIYVYN